MAAAKRGLSEKNIAASAFWVVTSGANCDLLRRMDADGAAKPEDIVARKRPWRPSARRLSKSPPNWPSARAKAAEDSALIAHQNLRIAKLERQIYGQRSERSSRLIDQLALTFEELAAGATEDELAAEQAVSKVTTVRGFTRKRAERQTFPEIFPERGGDRSADSLK